MHNISMGIFNWSDIEETQLHAIGVGLAIRRPGSGEREITGAGMAVNTGMRETYLASHGDGLSRRRWSIEKQ